MATPFYLITMCLENRGDGNFAFGQELHALTIAKLFLHGQLLGNETKAKSYGNVFLKIHSIADKNIFDCKNSLSLPQ